MLDLRLKLKQKNLKSVEFYLTEEPSVSDIVDLDDIEIEEDSLETQVIDLEVSAMAAGLLHHISHATGNDSRSNCGNVQSNGDEFWQWVGKGHSFVFRAYYISQKGTKVIIPSSISYVQNL